MNKPFYSLSTIIGYKFVVDKQFFMS